MISIVSTASTALGECADRAAGESLGILTLSATVTPSPVFSHTFVNSYHGMVTAGIGSLGLGVKCGWPRNIDTATTARQMMTIPRMTVPFLGGISRTFYDLCMKNFTCRGRCENEPICVYRTDFRYSGFDTTHLCEIPTRFRPDSQRSKLRSSSMRNLTHLFPILPTHAPNDLRPPILQFAH